MLMEWRYLKILIPHLIIHIDLLRIYVPIIFYNIIFICILYHYIYISIITPSLHIFLITINILLEAQFRVSSIYNLYTYNMFALYTHSNWNKFNVGLFMSTYIYHRFIHIYVYDEYDLRKVSINFPLSHSIFLILVYLYISIFPYLYVHTLSHFVMMSLLLVCY